MNNNWQMEEMCMHGWPTPVDCPVCQGTVKERRPSRDVWRSLSPHADCFHSRPDCTMLQSTKADIECVCEDSVLGELRYCPVCFDENGNPRK